MVIVIGAADLGDELLADELLLADDGVLQLLEAALAQLAVGGPGGLVERPAGRGDGEVHVVGAAVGDLAEHLFGGRVDVVEPAARLGVDELAVDQHALLALDGRGRCPVWSSSSSPPSGSRSRPVASAPRRCGAADSVGENDVISPARACRSTSSPAPCERVRQPARRASRACFAARGAAGPRPSSPAGLRRRGRRLGRPPTAPPPPQEHHAHRCIERHRGARRGCTSRHRICGGRHERERQQPGDALGVEVLSERTGRRAGIDDLLQQRDLRDRGRGERLLADRQHADVVGAERLAAVLARRLGPAVEAGDVGPELVDGVVVTSTSRRRSSANSRSSSSNRARSSSSLPPKCL